MRIVLEIDEGRRVAISRVNFEGNHAFTAQALVDQMGSKPEGFFFWRNGEYDEDQIQKDLTQKLPDFYGARGYVDFQVLGDTLLVDDTTGKATLVVRVSEGQPYRIGTFEIAGNRHFTTDEIQGLYPFSGGRRTGLLGLGGTERGAAYFNQSKWDDATNKVYTAYRDDGYLYVQIQNDVVRRVERDGTPVVDLRWFVQEHQPAIVNKVDIVGNDVTHETVIRDAIELVPGDVFRQNALLRSYQNISNLGFFQQPLPIPDTRPANDQGDVDVIFRVEEKRTGNVNFGASVGQGTGLGGFHRTGRAQPLRPGKTRSLPVAVRSEHHRFRYFVYRSRRHDVADLGHARSARLPLPVHHRRSGSAPPPGRLPAIRLPALREPVHQALPVVQSRRPELHRLGTRIRPSARRLAAATASGPPSARPSSAIPAWSCRSRRAAPMDLLGISQSGTVLGAGRATSTARRGHRGALVRAPLGTLGGKGASANPPKFVLGLSTRSGFVFGKSPFFDQLFTMGGTQFGIPLRGYDEFSITPKGYDPNAAGGQA